MSKEIIKEIIDELAVELDKLLKNINNVNSNKYLENATIIR